MKHVKALTELAGITKNNKMETNTKKGRFRIKKTCYVKKAYKR